MTSKSLLWIAGSLLLLALDLSQTNAQTGRLIFGEDFEGGLKPIWQPVDFSAKTEYSVQIEGTNHFLRASAASSASGLAVKVSNIAPGGTMLSWKWKIDMIPRAGSDDKLKTFDHTARVFVAFKTLIGPPRTINYVWGNAIPAGQTFHHPSSGRSRFIVLQTGNVRAGEWIAEQRDIARDWKMLFGEDEPPAIVGLGLMTDSDGTGTKVTGSYDDFRLTAGK